MNEYKLMPAEATPEMEQAAERYWNYRRFKGMSRDPRTWAGVYRAMRETAPAPEPELRTDEDRAAVQVVAELVKAIPVKDVLKATGTCADLIGYFKGLAEAPPVGTPSVAPDLKQLVEALEEARLTLQAMQGRGSAAKLTLGIVDRALAAQQEQQGGDT